MKIKTTRLIIFVFLAPIISFIFKGNVWAASSLRFSPASASTTVNSQFNVDITIDVESNLVKGADAVVDFNQNLIEVISVTGGGFFPDFYHALDVANGRIELHGLMTNQFDTKTGNGTYARLTLKSIGSTSSNISLVCSGNGNDTFILNDSYTNILNCAQVNQFSLTVSSTANTPTYTPTPTPPPGVTYTPTPTQVPGSNTVPTCATLSVNPQSDIRVNTEVTFSCTGVDPDGDITEVEFDFGDRSTQKVTKNVGSPGTLTATHRYTYVGTFGASCKVRDNNNVYSGVPGTCTKTITVLNATTNTVSAGTGTTKKPTPTPTRRPTSNPNPTAQIVDLKPYTSPTPIPTIFYEPDEDETEETGILSYLLYLIFGGGLVIGFYLIFRHFKEKDKNKPHPPVMLTE